MYDHDRAARQVELAQPREYVFACYYRARMIDSRGAFQKLREIVMGIHLLPPESWEEGAVVAVVGKNGLAAAAAQDRPVTCALRGRRPAHG